MAANPGRKTHIYLVDHSLTIRATLEALVAGDRTYQICGMAPDAETALAEIDYAQPDMILVELDLPGMDGLTFLDKIRRHWKPMQVIIISRSAKPGTSMCSVAFNHGAAACFDKSKLVNHWRELLDLLDEVRAETGIVCVRDPSAVTLPGLYEYAEEDAYDFA